MIVADLMPTIIGIRYQVLDKLGAGSMGTVYAALDRLTGRHVALKHVSAHAASFLESDTEGGDMRRMMAHEFRALASLRHPHIVTVLDYGFDDANQPYYVMELLENAQTILEAARPQPFKVQVNLLVQVLQALAYLHRRGIVHRDLKPGNVMVAEGQVKVLDFGLAIARGEASGTAGTLAYMAPEILTGQPADASTDLYGVGMIAYELFVGRHPFKPPANAAGTPPDIKTMINDIMRTPPELNSVGLNSDVAHILGRLLAKKPSERYATAVEVIEAFSGVLNQPLVYETPATRESFLQAAQFVGRDAELAQLSEGLRLATGGKGSTWLVGGESGVGKSRLVDELRVLALVQGILVLRGQAVREGGRSYQVWREVLRWLCLQTDLSDLEASVLQTLVPDVSTLIGRAVADLPDVEPQAAHDRLLSVVESIFQRQKRPIMVILEDLHWAHNESLLLLAWLNRKVKDWPLLIIGNYRDDERLDLPTDISGTRVMRLGRLSAEAITQLSQSMLGVVAQRTSVVNLLQREAEGNVFILIEIVRALAEEAGKLENIGELTLPGHIFTGGVQQIIRRRLSRVSVEARPLLRAAAVAGRDLDLKVLALIDPKINIETWVGECADAAVFDVVGDHWSFAHDKLRETLLAELTPDGLIELNRQVALAIEKAYPADNQLRAEQVPSLAYHWAQAKNVAKERYHKSLAAKQALNSGAYKDAIDYLQRVIALSAGNAVLKPHDTAITEFDLGLAYYGLANLDRSRTHLYRALSHLGWKMPTTRNALYISLAAQLILHFVPPARWLAHYGSRSRSDLLLAARICSHLSQITYFSGDIALAIYQTMRLVNFAEATQPSPELARGYANMALAADGVPLYGLAQRYSRRGLAVAKATGDPIALAYASFVSAVHLTSLGDWEQAQALYVQAREIFEKHGNQRRWREVLANLGFMLGLKGDFEISYDIRAELEAAARYGGDVQAQGWGQAGMGEMSVWLHHGDDAIRWLQARIDLIAQFPDHVDASTTAFSLLALAYWRTGQRDKARQQADIALKNLEGLKFTAIHSIHGYASLAETYLRLWEAYYGQADCAELADGARKSVAALTKFARSFPVCQPWTLRNRGMCERLLGNESQAARLLQQSLAKAEQLNMPYDTALAYYEIGRCLDLENPARRTHLQRAVDLFRQLGARYDLDCAQSALDATTQPIGFTLNA